MRLGRFDTDRLSDIVRLAGLTDPGEPIRVVLASEDSELARTTPSWIAGLAHGPSGTIALFPSRSVRYPHDSLESVLQHEVAHILIHRAAGGHDVPRWFNEGLATIAEREWRLEDRRRLAWALLVRSPRRMTEVDQQFLQGPAEAGRAYAVSTAFVRHIRESHGAAAPGRILGLIATGVTFERAFAEATGMPLSHREAAFLARIRSWERWVPLVTSPLVLWTGVTLLALVAIWRRRRRSAALRRRWAEEDAPEALTDRNPGT
ncbi:MAG TPA: hypothetical protein VLD67_16835 [Vicinamibacterales bacterium]|nr:hypothetical protein [Vicinamibacterales bacterium]